MSSFRSYRGGLDRSGSGGHHYRAETIKSAPPPPVIGAGSGRTSDRDRHYNERHRSRSPIPFRNNVTPREPPGRQQQASSRTPRHEEHSQRVMSSSRHQDQMQAPQVGSSRYQDQASSREASSRHAEPTKRAPASSSRKLSSPHSSARKPASSNTSKSSKSKTSQSQSSSTALGTSTKSSSSRPSVPDLQSSSRITINESVGVIREILNPNDVKIPRRAAEGTRPIFDRDELRESIQKRIKTGDNEQNPVAEPIEQRVVAIIREPVLIDPYAALASSSSSSRTQHTSHAESRPRARSPDLIHTTSSGIPFRLNVGSSSPYTARRSLSPIRLPTERERDIDRKRGYHDRDDRDHANGANFRVESPRNSLAHSHTRRERSRSRSRSRSPVDRVRRVTLNHSSAVASSSFANRSSGERDLRETLSRAPKPGLEDPVPRDFEPRGAMRGRGFGRGGFFRRPRGVFGPRGRVFARRVEPQWQHDKFDRAGGDSGNPT